MACKYIYKGNTYTKEEFESFVKENLIKKSPENQFLNLLGNKNNWVTFFVKSIIQDSAKKGYEKVLFPKGDTAAKIEGHQTLEEFKKQKEDRIAELEKQRVPKGEVTLELDTEEGTDTRVFKNAKEAAEFQTRNSGWEVKGFPIGLDLKADPAIEINQLRQELADVESGQTQLSSIAKFYEDTITNILKKQGYDPVEVTDEHGNKWNEVEIDLNRDSRDVLLNKAQKQGEQDLTLRERLFDGMDSREAKYIVERIAKSNHSLAPLAKKLVPYIDLGTPIELIKSDAIISIDKDNKSLEALGVYYPNDERIEIAEDATFKELGSEGTILHEVLHHLTVKELRTDSKARDEFKLIYERAKKELPDEYATSNLDEFIVGIFTDNNFINKLKEIKGKGKKFKNLWEEIWDYVVGLFNINKKNSLYEQAFALSTQIIEQGQQRSDIFSGSLNINQHLYQLSDDLKNITIDEDLLAKINRYKEENEKEVIKDTFLEKEVEILSTQKEEVTPNESTTNQKVYYVLLEKLEIAYIKKGDTTINITENKAQLKINQDGNTEYVDIDLSEEYKDGYTKVIHNLDFNTVKLDDFKASKYSFSTKSSIALTNRIAKKIKANYGVNVELMSTEDIKEKYGDYKSKLKGFTDGETIILNLDTVTHDTAYHELTHILLGVMKSDNRQLYDILTAKALEHPKAKFIQSMYPELNTQELGEEIFSSMVGEYIGKTFIDENFNFKTNVLKQYFDQFVKWLKSINIFGSPVLDLNMSIEEIIARYGDKTFNNSMVTGKLTGTKATLYKLKQQLEVDKILIKDCKI